MLCKYCGKLLTTKKTCLCCGSHNGKGKTKKLTPEQLKEYELLVAKQEEEKRLAEEARIQAEKERKEKNAKKYGKLSKIGLIASAVPLLVTLIMFIIKLSFPNFLSSKNVHSLGDNAYVFGIIGFTFAFITLAFSLVTLFFSIKEGKKRLWILAVSIAMVPVAFLCAAMNNGNTTHHGMQLLSDSIKRTYVVGEELNLDDLEILISWKDDIESIKGEDFDIVIAEPGVTAEDIEQQGTKKGTIYVIGFDTRTTTEQYQDRQLTFYICQVDNMDNLYACANSDHFYYVNNA